MATKSNKVYQQDLEPEIAPEWEKDFDPNYPPMEQAAGVSTNPISIQDAIQAQVPEGPERPGTFQEAIEQSASLAAGLTPAERAGYARGTGSEQTDTYAGSVLGTVEAMQTGEPIYDAIGRKVDEVTQSVDANGLVYNQVVQDSREMLRSNLSVAAQASEGDAKKLLGIYDEISKWDSTIRSTAGFEAYTEQQLNAIGAIRSAEGNRVIEENYYRRFGDAMVAKVWEDTSTPRAWYDGIKAGIGISTTVAMADWMEKFEPGNFGSVVNSIGETVGRVFQGSITGKGFDGFKQTLEAFWQLPATQRVAALGPIEKHIREISYNKEAGATNVFVYMGMMAPFIDRTESGAADLDYLMDSLTVLGWAPIKGTAKILKFAKNAAQARKPIKILRDTGNTEKAAQLINRALADNDANVKKITGQSRAEVAHDANVMDMSGPVPEQITGVAAEAQKQLEKQILEQVGKIDEAYVRVTDPTTPERFYYDEAAKAARQREVLGDFQDDVQVATITESTETGFTVEVQRGFSPQSFYDRQTREASLAVARRNLEDAEDQLVILSRVKPTNAAGKPVLTANEETKALINKANTYREQVKFNERLLKDLDRPPTSRVEKINYTFDEAGKQDAVELGTATVPHVASPSQVTDQLVKGATDAATLAEFTSTQILQNLYEASRQVLRGLTGGQQKQIDALLVHGDELGRTFDVNELIGSGVQTKQGLVRLNDSRQVGAYMALRRSFDHIHRIENYLKRRGLENAGFQEFHSALRTADGKTAKMYAKVMGREIPAGIKRIYDHRTGRIENIEDLERTFTKGQRASVKEPLQGRLDGEWRVMRFRTGVRSGDEVVNYGLVRENELRPISGQVLNYRPGYVPKLRQNVHYVASKRVKRVIDGIQQDAYETARFFRNRNDAEAWRLQQADADVIDVVPDKKYRSPTHRSFDEEFDDVNFGGLYFGERTERDILMGVDGTDAHRVSAYKALSMNMNHIANRYPLNELRMSLIGKFQNTYGEYLENPTNWEGPLKREAAGDTKLRSAIEAQRRYIKDLMRVPTMSEDWWANRMRSMAESLQNRPPVLTNKNLNAGASDFFMNLASKDPISVIRAVTFHQYLGAFNPAQVLVQGMGFATALAAYPTKALKLLPMNVALMSAWTARKNEKAVLRIGEYAGADTRYLADVVKEIQRTGLFDSLKSTADYAAAENGFSMSAEALRRMGDAGLMFMRGGEQWSRGYGYLLARDLFMKNKPKGYKLTDKDIDKVAADSLRFTLNLNRANRAWWQKGLLSIPTQFYQVQAKFVENMLGGSLDYGVRKWTPAEKLKIMSVYMAMFGAAGIPFTDGMVADAVNAYRESTDDPNAMTPDRINPFNNLPPELRASDEAFAKFIQGGIAQTIASMTGSDPEIATRFSIAAGFEETFDLYKSGQRGVLDAIGGAAAPGVMRWVDSIKHLHDIFGPGRTLNITDEEIRQGVMEMAGIFSSTRNAVQKAYWYDKVGKITNSKGEKLFPDMETDEFSSMLVWQGLGFQPAKIGWMYDVAEHTTELEGRVKAGVDEAAILLAKYAPTHEYIQSQANRDNLNHRINLIILDYDYTQGEYDQFYEGLKRVSERAYGDSNKLAEIIDKAVDASITSEGRETQGSVGNPLLVPEGT